MKFEIELTAEEYADLLTIFNDQIEREGSCDMNDLVKWFVLTGISNYDGDDLGG